MALVHGQISGTHNETPLTVDSSGKVHSVQSISQAVTTLLDVATNTTGAAVQPDGLARAFQVVITGTATVVVEVSVDGTNYETIRTSTADEAFSTAEPWPYVRAVSSGMSAATAKVYMAV